MSRNIIGKSDLLEKNTGIDDNVASFQSELSPVHLDGAQPLQTADNFSERAMKLIPTEVITFYIMAATLVASTVHGKSYVEWIVFVLGIIGTCLYLIKISKVTDQVQIVLSVICFITWAYYIGMPFNKETFSWYDKNHAAIGLLAINFLIPVFYTRN